MKLHRLTVFMFSFFFLLLAAETVSAYETFIILNIDDLYCSGCDGDLTRIDGASVNPGIGISTDPGCGTLIGGRIGPSSIGEGVNYTTSLANVNPGAVYYFCLKITTVPFGLWGGGRIGFLDSGCQTLNKESVGQTIWDIFILRGATCGNNSSVPNYGAITTTPRPFTFSYPFTVAP